MQRRIIVGGLLLGLLGCSAAPVYAACDGVNVNRSFVSQPPDVVFTAGVPETKYIRQVWAIWPSPLGGDDCGAMAKSTLPSVKIQATYCTWDNPSACQISNLVQVDDASGPAMLYVAQEVNHIREVPVIYDGQGAAGTSGRILFGQQTEIGGLANTLGTVNVRIASPAQAASGWMTVTAAPNNLRGDSIELNSPWLNAKPNARVFAMHLGAGTATWNHPIAVTYDRATARWRIRNEDSVAMPAGLSFVVRIDPSARVLYTASGSPQRYLIIDDPIANNNPYAVIIATPTSSGTRRMRHPYGVAYVAPHWQVLYTDGALMPTSTVSGGAGFMVKVFGGGQYIDDTRPADPSGFQGTHLSDYVGTDIVAAAARVSGPTKALRKFCWTGGTKTRVLATYNMTPLPPPAPVSYNWVEAKYYGVAIGANSAEVFHQDGTRMDERTPFNVWGEYQSSDAITQCRASTIVSP